MATIEQAVSGGVSFELTDEQKELRALAREFAAKEIRPKSAEYDVHMTHPEDVIAKAHAVGLMNVDIRPESVSASNPLQLCATVYYASGAYDGNCVAIAQTVGVVQHVQAALTLN